MFSHPISVTLLLALSYMLTPPNFQHSATHFAEACSSRTVPKPRPSTASKSSSIAATPLPKTSTTAAPTTSTTASTTTAATTTTARPNITFPTYKCPATYDAWYCLNEATCFSVKIGDSIMYNCECAIGFMGPRCEYKELDGSYLPKRPRPLLEKASIASGAALALLFMLFVCLTLYMRYDQKAKFITLSAEEEEEDDDDIAGTVSSRCRYCSAKCCSDDVLPCEECDEASSSSYDNWWLRRVAGVGGFVAKQSHLKATMPVTFAVKRTTKM